MIEFAPGLLSITTGWPQLSCIFAPSRRAMMSLPPPGGKPTTMWMGFEGKPCAHAPSAPHSIGAASIRLALFIRIPPGAARLTLTLPYAMIHEIRLFQQQYPE